MISLQDQANKIMRDGLLLGANLPCLGDPIDEDNTEYVDKMGSGRMGYSFLNDPENGGSHWSKDKRICSTPHILQPRAYREIQ